MSNVYFKFKNDNDYYAIYSDESTNEYLSKALSVYKIQDTLINISNESDLIRNDDFILCPLYGDLEKSYFDDFQYGATETYKKHETDTSAFDRCLGEELGLRYNLRGMPYNAPLFFNRQNWVVSIVDIKDVRLLTRYREEDKRQDDKSKKMATIIYGTEDDIEEYLNTKLVFDKSSDALVGIVAIKFGLVKYLARMKKSRK
jgi:hypothetical protein